METRTIERLDKRRYLFNVVRAVALVFFIGGLLARFIFPNASGPWDNVIQAVYGFGCGMTCVAGGALLGLTFKIRNDAELDAILNNEMYRHYTMRSKQYGFIAMLTAGAALLFVTWVEEIEIPGAVCTLSMLFVGLMAQAVALLVYDRSR